MNEVLKLFEAGAFGEGMGRLRWLLWEKRTKLNPEVWKAYVAQEVLSHPIRTWIHQDPLTYRAFTWPRGYPGDGITLDYVYGCGRAPACANEIAAAIFQYTTQFGAALAVCNRRELLAQLIDQTAERILQPRILSLAAGHLREIELSNAAQRRAISEFVALDQDQESLQVISQDYAHLDVTPVHGTIRQILSGQLTFSGFDLVYAAGLFDYLTQATGRRLARLMCEAARENGMVLIANFLPGILDVGYMESLMNWKLLYRTEAEIIDLFTEVPRSSIAKIEMFYEPQRNIAFALLHKR